MTDFDSAATFMAKHARLLDRRRFGLLAGDDPAAALAALAAYQNPDGGYGSGLEPDMRSTTSQPVSALHAFEVFLEVAPTTSDAAIRLCDWLAAITLPDGGLPFGLPMPDTEGTAPFFAGADPHESHLHMTSMLAGSAHQLARHDKAVAEHPWLGTATDYSMRRIKALREPGHALEMLYVLRFLDAAHDVVPGADAELRRVGKFLPEDGSMHVAGGAEGETISPLNIAPDPDRPLRTLFSAEAIDAELKRLAAEQREDGGWTVDWDSYSAAGTHEWRGWATVRALRILRANGAH